MSLDEETNLVANLARSLQTTISEITVMVGGIKIGKEDLMEVGCYLHRTSPAIMELQMIKNTPPNVTEILKSLSNNVNMAKHVIRKCGTEVHSIRDPKLKSINEQLQTMVRNIGQSLSMIPSSTFKDQEYVECAIKSLSKEMQNAHLRMSRTLTHEAEDKKAEGLQLDGLAEEEKQMERSITHCPIRGKASVESPQLSNSDGECNDMPRLVEFLRGMGSRGRDNHGGSSQQPKTLPQVAGYLEPLYETFFCPLTKKIMDDPVTIGSGMTYERKAITEWFKKYDDCSQDIVCPTTGQKLESRTLNTNAALKITIEEWKQRNEAERIKVARAALSEASSPSLITEALKDLQHLCRRKRYNGVQIRNAGVVPLLIRLLEYDNRKTRCEALETLRLLVEDDECKEMIAKTKAIEMSIKMLSSDYPPERHMALLFLLELSRYEPLCAKIGSATGAILVLTTIKYNKSNDTFAAEIAEGTLKNLEKYPKNIKFMAENGLLEPLLNHLIEGSEEMQLEMGNYLGEVVLGHDTKTHVAQRASSALIKMVHSGNTLVREAGFKALVQISSYQPNRKVLTDAGILPAMTEELFTRRIYSEPMNSEEQSTLILANILESELHPETLQVNTHGQTMASDYIIYNIIHMLKKSIADEVNINLIRILLCLTKSPKALPIVIHAIKETETSYTLIQLINSPEEHLSVMSAKLLINISPYIGHTIADELCKTNGQIDKLLKKLETDRITEKHAVWINFLAKLPHQNLTLNLALLNINTILITIQKIHAIQRGETRTSRYATSYLEGLVGILVRFTTTLYDPQILLEARNHNLAAIFTELLTIASSDEVQRLSAVGLEKLSSESIHLSKTPQNKKPKFHIVLPRCLTFLPTQDKKFQACPIHRGSCSSQTTFCLLDSRSLERLLGCLDNENVEVVEAALSAICTLLDDKLDLDKSVSVLSELNVVQHVLNVLREHGQEGIWKKCFWVIERFLRKGDRDVSDISEDRLLGSTLVSAFQNGETSTRHMAEKILRHLNKVPNLSSSIVL